MLGAISIALSGLNASAKKVAAAASNIANMGTTGALDEKNGSLPYTPQTTTQTPVTDQNGNSLGLTSTLTDKNPAFVPSYDPDSPFADENGIIGSPNVDLAEEIVNLKTAEISYKANLKTIQTAQDMSDELLNILDEKV